jgi:acetyltransferase-like isoleucine patch superfamily enzyme
MNRLLRLLHHASAWFGAQFWTIVAKARFRLTGCDYGTCLRVTGPLRLSVHPRAKVQIGNNVTLNSSWRHNPVGSSQSFIIWVSRGAELVIGDDVGISHAEIVSARRIEIGRRAKIGGGACLYDSNFHALSSYQRALSGNPGVESSPLSVGEDAFLGAHCIILRGVTVGDRSVVGAGSVVAKPIPPDQIWAGAPARFLRNTC